MQAAIRGAGEIGFTIVSISLSLIAVFIPLLLMGGIVGRLFREFAVTVTTTIVVSAIVSLTLTPMMCSRFLRSQKYRRHGRLYRVVEGFFDALLAGYRRSLDVALRFHFITFLVFLATVGVTVFLFITIPKGFFPQQDIGQINGTTEGAQDISFAEMARRQRAVTEILSHDPDIDHWVASVGSNGGAQAANSGRVWINLKPRDERTASAYDVIARLRKQAAQIEGVNLFMQASQDINVGGRPSKAQFQYTLQDADLEQLNEWAPKLLAKFRALPELQDATSDQQASAGTLTVTIDRDQAARFGISVLDIDNTLYDAFGQRQVTQYFTQLNSYYVIMEVLPELQGKPDTLEQIHITSPVTGKPVPLSVLVKYTTRPVAYLSINHQGQFPAVTLSFNLAPGVALGQAVEAIDRAKQEIGLPGTVIGSFQGTAQAFQTSLASQPYLIAAALIVVYIILGILYESYIHPLTILTGLPAAAVGALAALKLYGLDLSVIAVIGLLMLIGIVKKNAIMMIDVALVRQRAGAAPLTAIREACLLRFRPIMMTTLAAIMGVLPIAVGHGASAELPQPLGIVVVGGLLVSQLLTLFITPVLYLYMENLSRALGRLFRRSAGKAGGEAAARGPATAAAGGSAASAG